jgi:hypothetical protein
MVRCCILGGACRLKIQKALMAVGLSFLASSEISAQPELRPPELTIQQLIPTPARCASTPEPFFYCRHETGPEHSLVLDLASGKDGASASLTHDFDNRDGKNSLAIMRIYFQTAGIDAKAFDDCIWRSLSTSEETTVGNFHLVCRRVEFGERVTFEVFAMPMN